MSIKEVIMRIREIPKNKRVKPGVSYQMPKICACCLKPTTTMKKVKGGAGGYKWVTEFRWIYPLCKECEKHQTRWKRWRIWSVILLLWPVGFLTSKIYGPGDSVWLAWFIVVTGIFIVHKILTLIWLKKNPEHATAYIDPVVADWEASRYDHRIVSPTFWFKNPGFEKAFLEIND